MTAVPMEDVATTPASVTVATWEKSVMSSTTALVTVLAMASALLLGHASVLMAGKEMTAPVLSARMVASESLLFDRFFNDQLVVDLSSGHGVCLGPGQCHCLAGYKGASCAEFDCDSRCASPRGLCVGPYQCQCDVGKFGVACEVSISYSP